MTIKNVNLLGKLTVNTNSGADTVTVDPTTIGKDVSISTGDGPDIVGLEQVTAKAMLTINTGSGADRVGVVNSTVTGVASISTGSDKDKVGLVGDKFGQATVNAGDGDWTVKDPGEDYGSEQIGVVRVQAQNTTLNGGNASLDIAAKRAPVKIGVTDSPSIGSLTIKTGFAPDAVLIGTQPELIVELKASLIDPVTGQSLLPDADAFAGGAVKVAGTAKIDTGTYSGDLPDDQVNINNMSAANFQLIMGSGTDVAETGSGVTWAKYSLDGGSGSDTLKTLLPVDARLKNWEKIN